MKINLEVDTEKPRDIEQALSILDNFYNNNSADNADDYNDISDSVDDDADEPKFED